MSPSDGGAWLGVSGVLLVTDVAPGLLVGKNGPGRSTGSSWKRSRLPATKPARSCNPESKEQSRDGAERRGSTELILPTERNTK